MTNKTKLNIVLGYQAKQISIANLYNQYAKVLNINDDCVFVERSITPDNLDQAIKAIKALDIKTASIMAPHKINVIEYLDDVDSAAMLIGSVDTVINKTGVLTGYNTDWIGILFSLANSCEVKINNIHHIPRFLEGKKLGLIEIGLSTNAIIYAASMAGAEIMIFGEDKKIGGELVSYFKDLMPLTNLRFIDKKVIKSICACDIIINCSNIKNSETESPIDCKILNAQHTVLDFNDNNSKFLVDANSQGCKIITKAELINYQNSFQFELLTGHKIPFK